MRNTQPDNLLHSHSAATEVMEERRCRFISCLLSPFRGNTDNALPSSEMGVLGPDSWNTTNPNRQTQSLIQVSGSEIASCFTNRKVSRDVGLKQKDWVLFPFPGLWEAYSTTETVTCGSARKELSARSLCLSRRGPHLWGWSPPSTHPQSAQASTQHPLTQQVCASQQKSPCF